jgi:hypothetical protein
VFEVLQELRHHRLESQTLLVNFLIHQFLLEKLRVGGTFRFNF